MPVYDKLFTAWSRTFHHDAIAALGNPGVHAELQELVPKRRAVGCTLRLSNSDLLATLWNGAHKLILCHLRLRNLGVKVISETRLTEPMVTIQLNGIFSHAILQTQRALKATLCTALAASAASSSANSLHNLSAASESTSARRESYAGAPTM